jgi:hypothetical protein
MLHASFHRLLTVMGAEGVIDGRVYLSESLDSLSAIADSETTIVTDAASVVLLVTDEADGVYVALGAAPDASDDPRLLVTPSKPLKVYVAAGYTVAARLGPSA